MKKLFLSTLILLALPSFIFAQNVGVDVATPQQKLDVAGGIKIGNATTGVAGSLRWNGSNFQVHDGSQWITFGTGSDNDWTISGVNMYSQVSGNVGIGTPTPTYKLQVAGTTRLNSLNINGNYTLPTTDGGAGFVLRTDGFGNVSWSNPTAIGDITSVIAGDGLINGGTSGDVTLDVNPGDGIQIVGDQVWVNPSALDNPTNGLSVVSDDFVVNVDNTTLGLNGDVLRVAPNGISSSQIADGSITSIDVANNTLTAADIATGAITSDEILDGTILSIDVANNTLTADDIATGAITTDEILDGTIQSIDVANNSLTAIDIATGAVTTDEIADETILPEDVDPSAGAENQVLSIVGGSVTWSNPATLNATLQDGDADTYIRVDNGADDDHIRFFNQNTEHMTIDVTGEVGIGTNTPERDLHVVAAAGGQILASRGDANTNTGETLGELMFDSEDDTNPSTADASAVIRGIAAENHGNSNKGGHLAFLTKNNTALSGTPATERMRITSAGNVGIGEDVPSQKLHVAGGARITNLSSGVVVSDANGVLSISTDLDGTGWGDNLGNHIASQNVRLNGNWLSNDGGNEGIQISNIGNVQLTGSGTIGLTTLADGWFKVGTTLSMDPNEIHFGTDGHFGTIGAYDLMFRSNGSERMRLLANGNFGIGTAAPGGTLHVQGDFYNQELVGQTRYDDDQTVAWNAGATQIDIGSTDYVRVVKADGTGANNSSILVVASVSVSGNTITFADGVGGYQQVYALMNGMATFTVTLQRRINNGSWTNLIRQSAICGIGIGDWYTQYNNIANQQGKHGDEFRFPNSVSLSYFDDPGNGNVDYRLVFTPGGSRKNGGNYLITDRNLTAVQIKR